MNLPDYVDEDELLTDIAFHESGHAVAAVALGIPVRRASIVPDEDGGPHVIWAKIPDRGPERVIILLAGSVAQRHRVAQRHHNPNRMPGDDCDLQQACEIIDGLARPDDRKKWFAALSAEAEDIIDRWWPGVEALAQELLQKRTMRGIEITECIRAAMPNSEPMPVKRYDCIAR